MLGSFQPRKGYNFLFQSFARVHARLPEAHLIIGGCGTTEEEQLSVYSLIAGKNYAGHVHFAGFVDPVASLIAEADVLAVPSQFFEPFGYIVIEAMAQSVPVVTTDVGGFPEVVGDAGFFVNVDDVDGFARYLINILSNPSLKQRLDRSARKRFDEHFHA